MAKFLTATVVVNGQRQVLPATVLTEARCCNCGLAIATTRSDELAALQAYPGLPVLCESCRERVARNGA